MSSANYLIRKAEESILWRELMSREYDIASQKNQGIKPDDPAEKIVPAPPPANLAITRPESFSFQEIERFFFKKNVPGKVADLEKQSPFQEVQPKDGAANVVQSTALQFNDINGTGVFFASNGAPESMPGQSGEMRSLLQQNGWSNRPLMV
jgi:hypothetical protein